MDRLLKTCYTHQRLATWNFLLYSSTSCNMEFFLSHLLLFLANFRMTVMSHCKPCLSTTKSHYMGLATVGTGHEWRVNGSQGKWASVII